MTIEQQVVSLDIAKRLKELGVKQESYFEWYLYPVNVHGDAPTLLMKKSEAKRRFTNDHCSAFTVTELGEMLPCLVEKQKQFDLRIEKSDTGNWLIEYSRWFADCDDDEERLIHLEVATTEADARGKMLIYLLENKLITL